MISLMRAMDVTTSLAASIARFGNGVAVGRLGPRPKKPLELYEFEGCPFCRKVREVLTMLDIEAMIYPCPKGGKRFRPLVKKKGGKTQFPFLVDPNEQVEMYESDDIVAHLYRVYGDGEVPLSLRLGVLNDASSVVASAMRPLTGLNAVPSQMPERPLELWSFEASPFCRLVREALCSLEIPYLLHNVGKGSPRRVAFVKHSGKMMVPYLADPNTGEEMLESADIVDYLYRTYGK
jgi:glutathione S-transferase